MCTRRRSVRSDSGAWTNDRKPRLMARLCSTRSCVSNAERASNSLSRISMSGIPGCSVARNTNLTRPFTQALAELPNEWGLLANVFVNDDSFNVVHERARGLLRRQSVVHRTTLAIIFHPDATILRLWQPSPAEP